MNKFIMAALMIYSMCLLTGCATQIQPSGQINQPPQITFENFKNIQLNKITLPAKYAGQAANEKAIAKIDLLLMEKVRVIYPELNGPVTAGKTLVIAPEIIDIKFIGGAARFWVGPMAGSSAVLMKVKFIDKDTGNTIAFPEFYSKCSAWAGAFSVGGNDNAMLHRVASSATAYISTHRR